MSSNKRKREPSETEGNKASTADQHEAQTKGKKKGASAAVKSKNNNNSEAKQNKRARIAGEEAAAAQENSKNKQEQEGANHKGHHKTEQKPKGGHQPPQTSEDKADQQQTPKNKKKKKKQRQPKEQQSKAAEEKAKGEEASYEEERLRLERIVEESANTPEARHLSDLRHQLTKDTLDIIHTRMPQKMLRLDLLWKQFIKERAAEEKHVLPSQPRKEEEEEEEEEEEKEKEKENKKGEEAVAHHPSNDRTLELVALLKREVVELMEMVSTVRTWVCFNIAPVSHAQNFESAVQLEIVSEMEVVTMSGQIILSTLQGFLVHRALLIEHEQRHPAVEDFERALPRMDEEQRMSMERWIRDFSNMYSLLHDLIDKNLKNLTNRAKRRDSLTSSSSTLRRSNSSNNLSGSTGGTNGRRAGGRGRSTGGRGGGRAAGGRGSRPYYNSSDYSSIYL